MNDGDNQQIASLELRNLQVISALGRGAKGVVFLVSTTDGELLALKAVLRASIEKKKKKKANTTTRDSDGGHYRRTCFERDVLRQFQHPLLPKLKGVISTDKIVGYAIDYCPGGDLHSLRKKQTEKMFSDDSIRFYAAELVLALEYLHGLGVVYRDLKPDNVMIQENGHIMLVDFDLSTKLSQKSPEYHQTAKSEQQITSKMKKEKSWLSRMNKCCNSSEISPDDSNSIHSDSATLAPDPIEKSNSFVGTEEYIAPEVVLGSGHDFSVDWWCLGVVLHEMLYGTTPFKGSNRKETLYRIVSKSPDLVGETTPLRDLIRKLLEKDPKQRISVDEIKSHEFFKCVDWDMIMQLARPPVIPTPSEDRHTQGNSIIDVELFVHELFKVGEDDEQCSKLDSKANKDGDEEKNKRGWVEGINPPTQIDTNFLVF